jgi:6-phosphogluconolactonase (cycloisomerase 2 family)
VNAGDFGISTTFPINVLSSGSSKDIVLRCTPSAAGTRTATLSLATNDLAHVLVIYDLSCDGTAVPRAGYDSSPDAPGPLTFAKTVVGQSSTVRLKVKEAGNLTLNISSTVLSGANASDFSVTTATPFQILNNGAPQDLVIQCTPSDVNLRTATLTINNNDPNRSSVPYALTCPAIPPSNYLVAGTSITNTASIAYLDGPYGVAVSPDGNNVFAIASNSGRILSFARATDSGLTYQNSVDPFGVLAGGRLTAVSPDGKQVYAAGYNTHEVVGFDRNAADGSATLKIGGGNSVSSLGGAFGVAISPDGSAVYATGYLSNSLVAFYRNPSTGILSKTQTIVSPSALAGATSISVSPDGLNVYVGGYTSTVNGQLAVFKRNVLNGAVTYQQTKSNVTGFCFIDCVAGLNGAYQTVVSPDGLHVYTVGRYDNAIAVFDRAPQDGTLTFNTVYKNGVGGITGLAGANAIVFSPDGEHVFVSSYDDKAVAVFLWDAASGQLGELQVIQRNPFGTATGNPPLQGARDLDISPDGKAVYVAGNLDDAIAVLLVANPTPILNNLTPASTLAGGSAFSLTVHGENFVTGATVYWNGSARATTFINSTQLLAAINASDVASGGGYPVKVRNPSPGASFSNIMTFTVSSNIFANPVPSITYINPQGTVAGSGVVTLTLNGTGFISSVFGVSVVRWNGSNLPTTFINSTQLQATVPATATVNAGIAGVTVANGGSSSNVVEFTIASPLQNPPPSLTQLSPVWVFSYGAGSPQVTLIVTGTNFVNGAKVQWNGVDLPTTFVNSTKLKATVTSAKLALPNNAVITAENPTPGGGTSNTLSFDVRKLYRNLIPLLIR